jgi:hypothetical protein
MNTIIRASRVPTDGIQSGNRGRRRGNGGGTSEKSLENGDGPSGPRFARTAFNHQFPRRSTKRSGPLSADLERVTESGSSGRSGRSAVMRNRISPLASGFFERRVRRIEARNRVRCSANCEPRSPIVASTGRKTATCAHKLNPKVWPIGRIG